MEVELVELDPNGDCIRETSIENLSCPGSPVTNDIFGDPLLNPRVGDEYQVDIPSIITESKRLELMANPLDSKSVNVSHSFLVGLPIPITWIHVEENDNEGGGSGSLGSSDDTIDAKRSVEARNGKKDQSSLRKKSSELNVEENAESMGAEMNLTELNGSKSHHPVPGLSTNPWSDAEVDSFLLGLYIYGKNFLQIKRFMGSKDTGEIISFYYGKFYRSDAYRRWSDSRKIKRKKCVTGRKIFTGWRQQELFSRLSPHVPEESQNSLLEGYKSFVDGRISLEEYVSALKSSVSIPVLVEAVAIGKGKEDLTGFSLEPKNNNHDLLVNLPTGQDCSSLTSKDIVNFLTGGFRLSKARCNDIFWEAVWPRLLAKGWHSEQPRDQGYISSKHYLVFLVPGIKKFSRRKLVKGEHYFDSVSDVLNKVATEPKLLELESEESSAGGRNEQISWSPVGSDQEDPSDSRRHCYLKPRVSTSSTNHMKFTVVDTSLFCGGKASSIRELRNLPAEFKLKETNHSMEDDGEASEDNLDEFETVEKPFHSEKPKHHKGKSDNASPTCMKFTVVDTSVVCEGKTSVVRELRCVVKSTSELPGLLRKTVNCGDSSSKHEKDADDIPSKGKRKISKSNSHKEACDTAFKNQMATQKNSDTADKMEPGQDQNTCISDEKHLKKTVLHQFKRRAKSGHSDFVVPVVKRRRLTACAKEKTSDLSHNCSKGLESKQMELQGTINSPEMGKNIVPEVGPEYKESSITYPAESSPEEVTDTKIMRQASAVTHSSERQKEEHQTEASNDVNPTPGDQLDSGNDEMLIDEVQGSKRANTSGHCSPSKEKELVSKTLKTTADVTNSEQNPNVNRRQSTRNRPLTARALEALANGFLNVQRRPKNAEIHGGENLFSSPFRKARSKGKVAPSSHGDAVSGVVASREDKEVSGDRKWLANH